MKILSIAYITTKTKQQPVLTMLVLAVTLLTFQGTLAQNIQARIIDRATKENIPYANIQVSALEHLVSNEEGYFNLSEGNSKDEIVITISYLGYFSQQLTINQLKKLDFVVALQPSIFELNDVKVSNVKPNPYEIMAQVKANLNTNHKNDVLPSKDFIFYRKSGLFKPAVIEVEINESTGFSKHALKKVNSDVQKFISKLISSPPKDFTDILGNYYNSTIKKDDKYVPVTKLEVLKATILENEGSSTSADELKKLAINTILQHLDSTKYYRAKSGLFGSRDTISLRKDFNKKKTKNKNTSTQILATKNNLNTFLTENNLLNTSSFNFIYNPEWYEYQYEGLSYMDGTEAAYVLTFKPKKSKAKYIGKLYISDSDYGVLRVTYDLDAGEKLNNVNLKLILGIKAADNKRKGTLMYRKKIHGKGYYLQYANIEKGQYFYVNRPLKFIELTSEEKDIFSLDIKIEGNTSSKMEYLNMSHTIITPSELQKVTEADFKFTKIKSYDPKIWKDYNAIEPLSEMKRFKTME
ncbi:carboxypeptidase-like regulatory domain-containing protein [Flavobacterium sandaracinum]|nr:carboxypeptidase-like regulatory domain-containing protein [Flavobacterium sandaracinum]